MTYAIGNVLDVLPTLDADRFQCVVTSPPYWGLRDYGTARWDGGDPECDHRRDVQPRNSRPKGAFHGGTDEADYAREPQFKGTCGKCGATRIDEQLGLEPTPAEYVANMVRVFREVRRVLRPDGVLWLNLGDSYASGEIGRHDNGNPNEDDFNSKDFGPRQRGCAALAPWPSTWHAKAKKAAQRLPPATIATIRSTFGIAAERHEQIAFKDAMQWTNDDAEGISGSILGAPFDRHLVRDALVLLVAVGASQNGTITVEIATREMHTGPGTARHRGTVVRIAQGDRRAMVASLVPGTPTWGRPMPLEGS